MIRNLLRTLTPVVPLLLHGILSAQQSPESARRITAASTAFAALQVEDGVLIAAGRDYRATFDQRGAHFVAALGEHAPVEQPVTLRGVAWGRGRADKPLAMVAPGHRERTVAFARGAVTETYEVRSDGLKQSFVFGQRPVGDGDLVVDVAIATDLPFAAAGADAVQFANELGGVRIAGVLGVDATGRQVQGSLAWNGSLLQLRLPGEFVDQAALPLILDPLIGSTFTVSGSSHNLDPDVAYDADANRYLIVWWRRYSANTADVYGQFVHDAPTGGAELAGSSVVLRSGSNAQRARVGSCRARGAFVVGWQEVLTVPAPQRDLFVRAARETALGGTQMVAGSFSDEHSIEIAGDTTGSTASVAVVWMAGGNAMGSRLLVGTGLGITPGTHTSLTTAGTTSLARISQNGGSAGRFLVGTISTSGVGSLRAWTGNPLVASGTAETVPSARSLVDLSIDGDGSRWAVAWAAPESTGSTNHDVHVGTWAWNAGTQDLVQGMQAAVFAQSGVNEIRPAVAVVDETFALTYVINGTTRDLRLRTFGMRNCAACETEISLATSTSALTAVIASQRSNGESGLHGEDALITWAADTGTTSPLTAVRWTADAGIATSVAAGCGGLTATAFDQCARRGASGHLAVLAGAPAGAQCWLVVSPDRRDATGCGTCLLVPDPWNAVLEGGTAPDALGNVMVALPIPTSTFLIGYRFYEQWLVADATTPGCPTFGFDFSNALQVQIQ